MKYNVPSAKAKETGKIEADTLVLEKCNVIFVETAATGFHNKIR